MNIFDFKRTLAFMDPLQMNPKVSQSLKIFIKKACVLLTSVISIATSAFLVSAFEAKGMDKENKDDKRIKRILNCSKNNDGKNSTFLILDSNEVKPSDLNRLDVFERLQNLTIKNIPVTEFPLSILTLVNLEYLNLSNINLSALPDEIGRLSHLNALILVGNDLQTLSNGFQLLRNLEILDLSKNQITEIPLFLTELSKLKEFNLENNRILGIPRDKKFLSWITNLLSFNLASNPLSPNQDWAPPGCFGIVEFIFFLNENKKLTIFVFNKDFERTLEIQDILSGAISPLNKTTVYQNLNDKNINWHRLAQAIVEHLPEIDWKFEEVFNYWKTIKEKFHESFNLEDPKSTTYFDHNLLLTSPSEFYGGIWCKDTLKNQEKVQIIFEQIDQFLYTLFSIPCKKKYAIWEPREEDRKMLIHAIGYILQDAVTVPLEEWPTFFPRLSHGLRSCSSGQSENLASLLEAVEKKKADHNTKDEALWPDEPESVRLQKIAADRLIKLFLHQEKRIWFEKIFSHMKGNVHILQKYSYYLEKEIGLKKLLKNFWDLELWRGDPFKNNPSEALQAFYNSVSPELLVKTVLSYCEDEVYQGLQKRHMALEDLKDQNNDWAKKKTKEIEAKNQELNSVLEKIKKYHDIKKTVQEGSKDLGTKNSSAVMIMDSTEAMTPEEEKNRELIANLKTVYNWFLKEKADKTSFQSKLIAETIRKRKESHTETWNSIMGPFERLDTEFIKLEQTYFDILDTIETLKEQSIRKSKKIILFEEKEKELLNSKKGSLKEIDLREKEIEKLEQKIKEIKQSLAKDWKTENDTDFDENSLANINIETEEEEKRKRFDLMKKEEYDLQEAKENEIFSLKERIKFEKEKIQKIENEVRRIEKIINIKKKEHLSIHEALEKQKVLLLKMQSDKNTQNKFYNDPDYFVSKIQNLLKKYSEYKTLSELEKGWIQTIKELLPELSSNRGTIDFLEGIEKKINLHKELIPSSIEKDIRALTPNQNLFLKEEKSTSAETIFSQIKTIQDLESHLSFPQDMENFYKTFEINLNELISSTDKEIFNYYFEKNRLKLQDLSLSKPLKTSILATLLIATGDLSSEKGQNLFTQDPFMNEFSCITEKGIYLVLKRLDYLKEESQKEIPEQIFP